MAGRKRKRKKARRGYHETIKLRGGETFARHVYDQNGDPQTFVIRVPDGYAATVFGVSVTSGFFRSIDDEGARDE